MIDILEVECPVCFYMIDDVYFVPTCGFIDCVCSECNTIIDLYDYTGMTYDDCSNTDLIENELRYH